jgi:hypothetical protein
VVAVKNVIPVVICTRHPRGVLIGDLSLQSQDLRLETTEVTVISTLGGGGKKRHSRGYLIGNLSLQSQDLRFSFVVPDQS